MSDTPRTDAATHTGEGEEWQQADAYRLHELSKQLERELSAALKDAQRYRWMKANVTRIPMRWFQVGWDVVIDAAIAAEKQPQPASAPAD